jgi:hypothetical protein
MASTYEPIATTTLGSAAATITFSSISSAYTDLVLVTLLQVDNYNGWGTANIRFNSDTGTNYSDTHLGGDGSTASSARNTSTTSIFNNVGVMGASTPSNTFALSKVNIFSYAGSTNKTTLSEYSADNNGSGSVYRSVGLWRNTSAITSISLVLSSGNFKANSTATLYGILKA